MQRLNRLAARRKLVDYRLLEVSVEAHGQGARNRRGRHHQHVRRRVIFGLKPCPLGYSKSMLFVDHCQPEVLKQYRVFDQGMRSDQQVQAALGQFGQQCFAGGPLNRACQKSHLKPQGLGPFRKRPRVLLRKNFGRSHQRRLKPVVNGQEHGHEGHQRFARSYVALHQAVHGSTRAHVAPNFAHHALLRFGQGEGQDFVVEALQAIAYAFKAVSCSSAALLQALVGKEQLVEKELFVGQSVARCRQAQVACGVVHGPHGLIPLRPLLGHGLGHPVAAVSGRVVQEQVNFCRQSAAVQLHGS